MDTNQPQRFHDDGILLPLQLNAVTIRRFRSLHDIGPLPIQPSLTVITGENDGGKTACLDAIAFLLGNRSVDDADRSRWAAVDETIEVEGLFYALDDPDRQFPLRMRARQARGGAKAVEVLDRVHLALGPEWAKLPLPELKTRMTAAGIPLPGGPTKAPYIDAIAAWLLDRPPDEWTDCWRPASREELGRLPRFLRFSAAEAQDPVGAVQHLVTREARRLLAEPRYADRLRELGRELDADVAPSLERVKETILQHCHDTDAVEITASFDFSKPPALVQLQVCRQGERADIGKGGEGRRRRVTLAIYEATLPTMAEEEPIATELIAYDEPDTHLDPGAQRTLFDVLDRQARLGHVQVLVATHSRNFIDKVPLQALMHFRLDEELKTRVEALASYGHADELAFLARVCAGLGLRNQVLLDERRFLVVEGETEEAAIPDLFRLVTGQGLTHAGINLVNTKGSGSVRRFVTMLAAEWRRDVVLLVDSDTREAGHRGAIKDAWLSEIGLEDGKGAYFVGEKEFEDAFGDQVWLRVLQIGFPPTDGGNPWILEDVAALRHGGRKFSEALCGMVRCRRRGQGLISKTDLGFVLAEVCTEEDVPPVLRDCFARALGPAEAPPR